MILTVCPNPSVDKFIRLPRLKPGGVNRSRGEQAYPGGKGVHVAAALTELGDTALLAGIWGGPTGQWIRDECEKKDIVSVGPRVDGWTRTCLTIVSEKGETDTEILEQGPSVTASEISGMFGAIEEHIGGAAALSVSGSWPAGSPDDVYDRLKKMAESAGIPFWADASGARLRQAIDTKPFGIHVNRSEVESLFGPIADPAEAARKMLAYCSVAAVTDGANGLFLAAGDEVWHASCRVERVISTVGCGDCLLAGVIHAHASGAGNEKMAVTGTACGAANCIRPELGMIYREDVRKLEKQVTSKQVN